MGTVNIESGSGLTGENRKRLPEKPEGKGDFLKTIGEVSRKNESPKHHDEHQPGRHDHSCKPDIERQRSRHNRHDHFHGPDIDSHRFHHHRHEQVVFDYNRYKHGHKPPVDGSRSRCHRRDNVINIHLICSGEHRNFVLRKSLLPFDIVDSDSNGSVSEKEYCDSYPILEIFMPSGNGPIMSADKNIIKLIGAMCSIIRQMYLRPEVNFMLSWKYKSMFDELNQMLYSAYERKVLDPSVLKNETSSRKEDVQEQ